MGANWLAGQIVTAEDLNTEHPGGLLADLAASGPSAAMGASVVSLPGTEYTISNTDDRTRNYLCIAIVRANMSSGTNGLYRPLVTDGTPAALVGGTEQFMITVTGGPGQSGSSTTGTVTVAPSGVQEVRAGALRVSGGSASDTLTGGRLIVIDLGPA